MPGADMMRVNWSCGGCQLPAGHGLHRGEGRIRHGAVGKIGAVHGMGACGSRQRKRHRKGRPRDQQGQQAGQPA
ncbi:hypothetical protein AA18890_2473 [Komagataeibacter europaeus LMG 18890]|nr:hypothetical protein AA18890_2473 [Komagataeibacter europaeus LMG 18890]